MQLTFVMLLKTCDITLIKHSLINDTDNSLKTQWWINFTSFAFMAYLLSNCYWFTTLNITVMYYNVQY